MAVTKLEITSRTPFADGESFGDVGPYDFVEGTAHFTVDPEHPRNEAINDLELALRDSNGQVRFSADFAMLQPADLEKGNRRIIFDVVNRGRKRVFGLNSSPRSIDPGAPLDPGNGFLMRHGFTVVWCGWQADVPFDPNLIGLQVPDALNPDGSPLTGRMLCQFQSNESTNLFLLADRQHNPHAPVDIDDPDSTLTVRDHPNGPATEISRDKFAFVRVEDEQVEPEPHHIHMASGFEAGKIYQLVYNTKGSAIVGLGMASIRDINSFLKYAPAEAGNPCADNIDYAYALGISQSGRFLRSYLYTGLNEDEENRMSLDGIIPHVAGGMRGEFNLRFGQPSKDVCFIIPELFPFTDTEQADPLSGETGSILAKLEERENQVPKVMFMNTSAEYWRGDAALIHTNLATMQDADESENVRRYHFAGTMHGSGTFPPETIRASDGLKGQLPYNSVDYSPLMRAALINLDRWVSGEAPAPDSLHPSLNKGTAVESRTLKQKFDRIPGVDSPPEVTRAMLLDFGPEVPQGRTLNLPPEHGKEYPALVSDVDADCNETGGIRLPDLTVPLATYTGWNLRHPDNGNPGLVIGITGGLAGWTLPFAGTQGQREAAEDPRMSIEERYESKDKYLQMVREAATQLVEDGYMLEEDIERTGEKAAEKYDYWTNGHES